MRRWILPFLVVVAQGCTTFSTVRSAEVQAGSGSHQQFSASSDVGDEAGWFYSFDCSSQCNRSVAGAEFSWDFGAVTGTNRGRTLGIGVNSIFQPFVEGYWQLGKSGNAPYGVGARVGIPLGGFSEHRLFGRVDVPFANGERLLWNPGLFYMRGSSPNGQNSGSILAMTNGLGIQVREGDWAFIPSVSLINARAGHTSYAERFGPSWSTFITAGVGVTFWP